MYRHDFPFPQTHKNSSRLLAEPEQERDQHIYQRQGLNFEHQGRQSTTTASLPGANLSYRTTSTNAPTIHSRILGWTWVLVFVIIVFVLALK